MKKTEKNLGPKVTQFDYRDSATKNVDLDIELSQKNKDLILAYDNLDRAKRTKKVRKFMNLDRTRFESEYLLKLMTQSHW